MLVTASAEILPLYANWKLVGLIDNITRVLQLATIVFVFLPLVLAKVFSYCKV
jgi:hypothetical protein